MFFTKAFKGNNAWYMYLVVLLLVFITTQLGGIPFILYKVLSNPETMQQAMSGAEPDTAALTAVTGNAELALMLLAFAAGLGSLFLFARVFQKKSAADITTGRPRFDWKRFAFGTAVWGALLLIISGASILTDDDIVFRFDAPQFFSLALVGLLLFPFQTGFEEVMFRDLSPTSSVADTVIMAAAGLVFVYLCNAKYRFLGRVNLWGRIEKPQVCAVNETEFKE